MKLQFKEFWNQRNKQIIYYRAYKLCATAKQKALDINFDKVIDDDIEKATGTTKFKSNNKKYNEMEEVKNIIIQAKEIVKNIITVNKIYKDEFERIDKIEVNSLKSYVDVIDGCLRIAENIYKDNIPKSFAMKFFTTPIGRVSLAESIVFMGSFFLLWDIIYSKVILLCG